jgi:hypothetical protein
MFIILRDWKEFCFLFWFYEFKLSNY